MNQPQFEQQAQYSNQVQVNPAVPGKGLATASMILGIVSLVLFFSTFIAIVCAITGLSLGAVSKGLGFKSGKSTAGIVCSAVAIVVSAFFFVLIMAMGAVASIPY
ncbi:MAG: hypothetical protein E7554_02650 [Ruminococcaceae bacterium]|nr:hypothetical protein [Oscillospiraceae bacterium]